MRPTWGRGSVRDPRGRSPSDNEWVCLLRGEMERSSCDLQCLAEHSRDMPLAVVFSLPLHYLAPVIQLAGATTAVQRAAAVLVANGVCLVIGMQLRAVS